MGKVQISIDGDLFQWEQERFVSFEGEGIVYAQFYAQKGENSIDVDVEGGQAKIPSKLLTQKSPLVVIACDKNNRVLARKSLRILARPRPESYQDEDDDEEILFYGGNANGTT